MNLINRMIVEDFRKNRDAFVKLGDIVHEMLRDIVKQTGMEVLGIEHRVKTENSLAGKLERNGDWYQCFDDLTDILGARVICYFSDEVDIIGKLVEKAFVIDWENSSDKRALISADTFGYLSLHYICSLPFGAGYPDEVCGKRFEIQIRTSLQHTWAQINHDLGYKSEFGVPREVVRNFSRIAGLLELADDEFVRAREQMKGYTARIRQSIIDNCADDVRIDMISLSEYVKRNLKMQRFLNELADITSAEISEANPDSYIQQLAWFGIRTLGGLQDMMERDHDLALELARKTLENSELDILASNVGLRYLCRAELIQGDYTLEQLIDFLTLSTGRTDRAQKQAEQMLSMRQSLKGDAR